MLNKVTAAQGSRRHLPKYVLL